MSWQPTRRLAGAALALLVAGSAVYGLMAATGPAAPTTSAQATHGRARNAPAAAVGSAPAAGDARTNHSARHHRAAHHRGSVPGGAAAAFRPALGVYALGMPGSYLPVQTFATAVGKQPRIVLFYSGFGEQFPLAFARQAYAHGATPLDQIEPTGISIAQVAAGRYDAYLKSYADEIRAYGHQVIVGFAHEMNGSWYSWGWTHVPAGTWVEAWRRVVADFRSQHATNVTWLWTISRVLSQGPVQSFWPGAAYVNWVGIDGYFTGPQDTFSNVFLPAMTVVHRFTNDPVLISESAIGQLAGQARMIPNLLSGVIRYHLLGLVWFDVAQSGGLTQQDWRLEGHPAALAAFRQAVRGFA
jgi:mannan endo-1,4-beta-mannosidase